MTVAVGDDVAHTAIGEQPRVDTGWHTRFVTAFGGAVVAVCLILLGAMWTQGLRAATFDDLRSDISQGGVRQWYVADELVKGDFDRLEARQAPLETTSVTDDGVTSGTTNGSEGDATGGILVWETRDSRWHVAAADTDIRATGGFGTSESDESTALVAELRASGAPMRAFEFGDSPTWHNLAAMGGLIVLLTLLSGGPPRVGTRWFWFWVLVNAPLLLGFIAYAVMELIGFRRRPDPPLPKRLTGIVGLVGAVVLAIAVDLVAGGLRSHGVPIPL